MAELVICGTRESVLLTHSAHIVELFAPESTEHDAPVQCSVVWEGAAVEADGGNDAVVATGANVGGTRAVACTADKRVLVWEVGADG